MKIKTSAAFLSALLLICLFAVCAAAQNMQKSHIFVVNDTGDTIDANPGDTICLDAAGKCTLRAAIQEANSTSMLDAVMFSLPAGSTIALTLGELTISSEIYIAGPGARKLTVTRSSQTGFRIFRVLANAGWYINFRGLKITGGTNAGGGIYIETGNTVYIKDSLITENRNAVGGGILNQGTLNITRSLVSSNGISGQTNTGGGLYNSPNATATIINSTFTDNVSGTGGGVYNEGTVNIGNSTFYLNRAGFGGANITSNSAAPSVKVVSTIIGKIGANSPAADSLSGNFTSLGSNIVTDATGSTGFTNGVNGDQVSYDDAIDPLFGTLADHGGQTDTFNLLAGSPAINRGMSCIRTQGCPAPFNNFQLYTDQRAGFRRFDLDPVDVGAYEYDAIPTGKMTAGITSQHWRKAGCLNILTSVQTGETQTRLSNQFGNVHFPNLLMTDVYIIESRCKRAPQNFSNSTILVYDMF